MGMDATARLAYGYDLGGSDHGWKFKQVDEYGSLTVAWPALDDEGFAGAAEHVLLASVGFTETDWRADGYFDRQKAAKERVDVEIVRGGSYDYPSYILAAKEIKTDWGNAEAVDFRALTEQASVEDWDGKLQRAMTALGLTTDRERPQWLLCAFYG